MFRRACGHPAGFALHFAALAVAAFGATGAHAQSSVTLCGIIDNFIEYVDSGADTTTQG